eukprot:365321-Chlamydomonas_euryale.AAC.2
MLARPGLRLAATTLLPAHTARCRWHHYMNAGSSVLTKTRRDLTHSSGAPTYLFGTTKKPSASVNERTVVADTNRLNPTLQ